MTDRIPKSDKDLWRSLALDGSPSSAAVSDIDFAAWLEGRLPHAEAARVDAAVARDPELRACAIELAEILGKPLPPAPPRLVVRAQALVGFAAERSGDRTSRTWFTSLLSPFGVWQRGVMAGLAVVVAAVGFAMGGGLGESFAVRQYASVEDSTALLQPFGTNAPTQLNDLFTDNI
ncbi:MAG TPA: hypothetical protein VJQ81_19440 [Reyranella sp.]|jgi:anti-sigma factor RsiW|nr:hypothetical protein [Reyranella sp.]